MTIDQRIEKLEEEMNEVQCDIRDVNQELSFDQEDFKDRQALITQREKLYRRDTIICNKLQELDYA